MLCLTHVKCRIVSHVPFSASAMYANRDRQHHARPSYAVKVLSVRSGCKIELREFAILSASISFIFRVLKGALCKKCVRKHRIHSTHIRCSQCVLRPHSLVSKERWERAVNAHRTELHFTYMCVSTFEPWWPDQGTCEQGATMRRVIRSSPSPLRISIHVVGNSSGSDLSYHVSVRITVAREGTNPWHLYVAESNRIDESCGTLTFWVSTGFV